MLPEGDGSVVVTPVATPNGTLNTVTVTIKWRDSENPSEAALEFEDAEHHMSRGIALRRATPLTARGFSVVELMVAMTLSLILMAGALSILYSSKLTYTENERIARLQEAGRTVVELVLRDARVAGYEGCTRPLAPTDFVNNLDDANSVLWNFIQPVFGYNASSSAWTPALDATAIPSATAGSDVIVLLHLAAGRGRLPHQCGGYDCREHTRESRAEHAGGARPLP